MIFSLLFLFSFVQRSIQEWWRSSLLKLSYVGITWWLYCLRSADPSLCCHKILGSIDCTCLWYDWLLVHWTSRMAFLFKYPHIIWLICFAFQISTYHLVDLFSFSNSHTTRMEKKETTKGGRGIKYFLYMTFYRYGLFSSICLLGS